MKYIVLPLYFLLFSLVVTAQTADELVNEGVALHDKGQYEEAIKKYDAAIAVDKNHYAAHYEKSYSLLRAKKYEESIDLSKEILKAFKDNPQNKNVYNNYGTCYDLLGMPKQALEVYDEGIKKFPDEGLIYFNKAITLYNSKKVAEAIEAAKMSISKNPYHASSHQLLSIAVRQGNKVYGLMASLAFLAIEPEGQRAKYHLTNAEATIGANVKKTGEKSISITLAMPDDKKKGGPDEFHMIEMTMSLSAALNHDDKYKNETAIERMKRNLELVFGQLKSGQKEGEGFGWTYYAPFFSEMYDKKYVEVFSHIIYSSANDGDNKKWLEENEAKVKEFKEWFKGFAWNKKV